MEYRFDLVVSGLDERDASNLFDLIVTTVDAMQGRVGGGFVQVSEEDENNGEKESG